MADWATYGINFSLKIKGLAKKSYRHASPTFVYKHAAHVPDSKQIMQKCKYQQNATVDKRTTARGYSESQGQAAVNNNLWLESTQIIMYANMGTRTIGILLFQNYLNYVISA